MASTVRSRKNTADNFECRVMGNRHITSKCAITRNTSGTHVVFESVHADVLTQVESIAADFPQVKECARTTHYVVVKF
jgi:hypothetical protein